MRANLSIVVVAGVLILGVGGPYTDAGAQELDLQKIKDLIGNQNLDPNALPVDVKGSLGDISKVVSETKDCATKGFTVTIPAGWQCRKLNENAQDVTLYTANNTLNLTIGTNQGKSSCDVIPGCTKRPLEGISNKFTGATMLSQPLLGTVEVVGTNRKNSAIKFLVTANNQKIWESKYKDIKFILNSIK